MRNFMILTMACAITFSVSSAAEALFDDAISGVDVNVRSLDRWFPKAEERNKANEIGVFEYDLDVEFDINPDEAVSWEWDFGFQHVFISDNSSSIDLPSMLVGRTMRVGSNFEVPYFNDDRFRIGLAVIPSYFTDSWSDSFNDFETSAFRWMSEYRIEYDSGDNLLWTAGVLFRPDFDLKILPVVGMNYAFSDEWSFRLTSDDIGFDYQYNDRTTFFTEHRYRLDEYEISTGGIDGRVLRYKQNTTGVGVQYSFNESVRLRFSVGAAYNRSFKFVDKEDQRKARLEETLYTTFELVARF